MVTSWTRGVAGQRASSSRSSRAVVDLPTATDPATPMTNGVPPTSSRRNVLDAACSAAGRLDVQVEQPGDRSVDDVDLGQVDGVAEAGEAFDVGVRERQRGRGGEPRPRVAVEVDVGGRRRDRGAAGRVDRRCGVGRWSWRRSPRARARTPASNSAPGCGRRRERRPGRPAGSPSSPSRATWDQMLRAIVSVSPVSSPRSTASCVRATWRRARGRRAPRTASVASLAVMLGREHHACTPAGARAAQSRYACAPRSSRSTPWSSSIGARAWSSPANASMIAASTSADLLPKCV